MIDLSYPYGLVQNILGYIIFLTFPGCFIGLILFSKYSKFNLIGIIILLNYIYYSLFGLIVLQFGYGFNEIHILWALIIGVIVVFGTYFLKKIRYQKEVIHTTTNNSMEKTLPFKKKFTYLIIIIILISVITNLIIYLYNYPFIYGDLWSHVSKINYLINGNTPPQFLHYGIPGEAVYPSWMSYIYVALGQLIINLPTYQVIIMISFFDVIIPILFFNFLLNHLINKNNQNFYKIKTFALVFFSFFSGFGGIIVIFVFIFLPQVLISQGSNFFKAIGIFSGDIFVPLRITVYFVQAFAIGIFFLGIGFIFKKLKNNTIKLRDFLFISFVSVVLMQTHYEICLIFLFLVFFIFLPLLFYKKSLRFSVKNIIPFTIFLACLTFLFNILFLNTMNDHFARLIQPIISYISIYFEQILIFVPVLFEIFILLIGVLSVFLILFIKGFRKIFFDFNKFEEFISKHKTKIIIVLLSIYACLFFYWVLMVSDFVITWTSGEITPYLLPTSMGFVLLFSILGIGIKKPINKKILLLLNLWAIFLIIFAFSIDYLTFSYSAIQTRLLVFIVPVLDILAALYLIYLLKNKEFWIRIKLNNRLWRSLFLLIVISIGSFSYIFYTVVQCQRGFDVNSKLNMNEIHSLDWIRENTPENSCIFGLTETLVDGVMVIAQRYITYHEGYEIFENLITTISPNYFWYWFNECKVSHIIISWERDFSIIDNLNGSYFEQLITTTNTSIIYSQNAITIYDVNLIKLEFL